MNWLQTVLTIWGGLGVALVIVLVGAMVLDAAWQAVRRPVLRLADGLADRLHDEDRVQHIAQAEAEAWETARAQARELGIVNWAQLDQIDALDALYDLPAYRGCND